VGDVGQEREEIKIAGGQIRPAYHPRHSFRVHRMGGEDQSGDGGSDRRLRFWKNLTGQFDQESRGQTVQEHVDQVVAPRLEAPQEVVETEGQHAEGAVGAVRAAVAQGGSPEVVLEEATPWGLRQQVGVAEDRAAAKDIHQSD
jgi:hypothetical protein